MGSLNTQSSAETFTLASEHMGDHLRRIPDGETGRRFHWVLFQGEVFDTTPGLTRMGEEPVLMAGFDLRPFTLDGTVPAEEIEFPALGYAEAAIDSYEEFVRLREAGTIRPGTRFQVSLPTPLAPLTTFVHPDSREVLERAYTSALVDEINEMISAIPLEDLAIQFDLAIEFAYIETAAGREVQIPSHAWFDPLIPGLAERAAAMIDTVPEPAEVGLHLCYGDVGEKHFVEPEDAANLTRMANEIAGLVERPLTWVHLPVPIERDDVEYFRPLTGLTDAFEELHLGLIHHEDGEEGAASRIAAAQAAGIPTFGVGTECGFGRGPAERTIPLMQLHTAVSRPLATHR